MFKSSTSKVLAAKKGWKFRENRISFCRHFCAIHIFRQINLHQEWARLETFKILLGVDSFNVGIKSWVSRKCPKWLTCICFSLPSSVIVFSIIIMPALLIKIWTLSVIFKTSWANFLTLAKDAKSKGKAEKWMFFVNRNHNSEPTL